MLEQEIDIRTPHGDMNTFITHPEEGGPHPIVLFFMDAPGKREELHNMARRIGTAGYYVMVPNLYYRRTRKFEMKQGGEEEMFAHMNSLTNALVCEDTRCLLNFASQDDHASDGSAGALGYCMSGPFVFAAAAAFPDRIAAAASFHGVRLATDADDSPHLGADNVKGELYFGCAETDEWAPKEMIDRLDSHLNAQGTNYRIEWYPGTGHGFVFPDREEHYDLQGAERHWERLHALFRRNL